MAAVEDSMWYYRALHSHVMRELARAARGSPAPRVLDAGCGTGGLLRRLRSRFPGWRLTGVDVEPIACDLARERAEGADIACASIDALPFEDSVFDAIASCDVICQVANPAAALRELARCLRGGGTLVLTLPAYDWLFSYHDRAVGNLRRYTLGAARQACCEAGLEHVRGSYWNTIPFPLAVAQRRLARSTSGASDVRPFARPIEAGFRAVMAAESGFLAAGGRFPFGCGLFVVVRKPSPEGGEDAPVPLSGRRRPDR